MELAPTVDSVATPPSKNRLRPRWGAWTTAAWGIPIALTAIVFQTLGAFGFMALWRYAHPEQPIALASIASNGAVLAFALAASTPVVLGLLAYVVRLSRVPLREYLALQWPRWRDVGVGVAALAAVLLGTSLLAAATGQQPPGFMSDTYTSARAAGMLPLLLVSFVFLGPLQEELLFRGFFFRGFAPALGKWPAVVLTAIVWALSHAQYQWFFVGEIFALGLVFGWLRARSGSTVLTIALHAAVNGMALVEVAFLVGS
jgi:uncharacterized protein